MNLSLVYYMILYKRHNNFIRYKFNDQIINLFNLQKNDYIIFDDTKKINFIFIIETHLILVRKSKL